VGRLPPALVKELAERLRRITRGANADVIILKVDKRALDGMIRIGKPPPRSDGVALH
jgi:CRISPR-associated protein Cas2